VGVFQAQNVRLNVCVIDNHSEPEALRSLEDRLPAGVRLVKLSENKAWGGAFNVVMRQWLTNGGSEFCFIPAHDAIPAEGCMGLLVRGMTADSRIYVTTARYQWRPGRKASAKRSTCLTAPSSVSGKNCIRAIGLLDERYIAYGDGHEIGLRARQRNWLVSVVWGAVVQNPGTWTASRTRSYLFARNSLLLLETYAGWGRAAARLGLVLPNTLRMLIIPPDHELRFLRQRSYAGDSGLFAGPIWSTSEID
jgi:GT2 family glycosyltransferase